MALKQLQDLVREDLAAIETLFQQQLQKSSPLINTIGSHLLLSGGKRLRPLTLVLSAKACGYTGNDCIPLAASMEFFHTATLLHDDVIDESTLRRGKPTANEIWGSKASVLVGDFLFTRAFQLLVTNENQAICALLSDVANTITEGEILQLSNSRNPQTTLDQYFAIIKCKTASLFSACGEIGALLVNAESPLQSAMAQYGLHLGNAFQLIDDAMDYCGDPELIGKNVGDDLTDGKTTPPLIFALEKATPSEKEMIQYAIKKGDCSKLLEIIALIKATGAIEKTHALAKNEIDKAITHLQALPPSPYKEALHSLAQFTLERES